MTVSGASSLLLSFKTKIEEAVSLVPSMMAEEKLKAVQFWNVVSERLQEIVNNSAADINALALNALKEKESVEKEHQVTAVVDDDDDYITGSRTEKANVSRQQVPTSIMTGEEVCQHFINTGATYDPASAYTAHQYNSPVSTTQQFLPNHSQSILSLPAAPSNLNKESSDLLNHSLQQPLPETAIENTKSQVLNSLSSLSSSTDSLHDIVPPTLDHPDADINVQPGSAIPLEQDKLSPIHKRCKHSTKTGKEKSNRENKIPSKKQNSANQKSTSNKQTDILVKKEIEECDMQDFPLHMPSLRALLERKLTDNVVCKRKKDKVGGNGIENCKQTGDESTENCDDSDQDETTTEIVVIHADSIEENKHKVICSHEKIDKSYSCHWCQNRLPSNSSMTDQPWDHTKPYICTECDAQFSTRGNLIVHQRRHTGEKPYSCSQCDARFSTKGNLKRHIKTHSGEKPWQCMQCGSRFTEKKSLKVHMRRHTGEKPYQCQVCGKSFAQTGILQTHMAMHLDQKAHLCEHCGKSFRQKSQLRLHMLRHEGVRKYACTFCPARFLTKGDLERHSRIHTGERPFVCELCGKAFTRQQSLNEHTNRHYGLKPYQCKYCGKGFAEMSACYKHIKHHERQQNTHCSVDQSQQYENKMPVTHPGLVGLPVENEPVTGLQLPESDALNHIVEVNQADYREIEKFTVLVHTGDQPLEVASEMTVEQREHRDGPASVTPNTNDNIAVAVQDPMSAFAGIDMLASASSFQQNY